MNLLSKPAAAVGLAVAVMACSSADTTRDGTDTSEVRAISNAEALADFDEIATSFRGLYGAMDRKQQKYGFEFDALVSDYRARVKDARTEAEYRGIFQEFISRFQDAHVSLSMELASDKSRAFRLPVSVMPVEDTFVVYGVGQAAGTDVKIGDELLAIDGKSPRAIAADALKYVGMPNALSAAHVAASRITSRPVYASNGLKDGAPATLHLRGADGTTHDAVVTWSEVPHLVPPIAAAPQAGKSGPHSMIAASASAAEITTAELSKMGARIPFFMTDAVKTSLGTTAEVKPSAAALAKFGLTADQAGAIDYFAATYTVNGKKVLLFRIPDYEPADESASLNYIRALFDDQASQVDALVVDETHNPGGSISFAFGVVSLLAKNTVNGMVQEMHADRLWIQSFADASNQVAQGSPNDPFAAALMADSQLVDRAYSANKTLSVPMPMFSPTPTLDADAAHWTKPVMMLTDELSVSCADFVPLLIQANGVGPLFGQRTMGGGGNVEQVATLTNTQGQLSISRGLGTVYDPTGAYPESRFIEDNGVTPDVSYSHTLADFRAGYVAYVNAFNATLSHQLGN
jgi:Peptidase family S41